MTRKKVVLARIANDNKRKSTLKKRTTGLFKKAEELSVLCGVETGVSIFNHSENETKSWPSDEAMGETFRRFDGIPEMERNKKMVTLEGYLAEKVTKSQEKINRIEKENNDKEMQHVMNQLIKGKTLHELDMRELKGMLAFAAEQMSKLEKRSENLQKQEADTAGGSSGAGSSSGAAPPPPPLPLPLLFPPPPSSSSSQPAPYPPPYFQLPPLPPHYSNVPPPQPYFHPQPSHPNPYLPAIPPVPHFAPMEEANSAPPPPPDPFTQFAALGETSQSALPPPPTFPPPPPQFPTLNEPVQAQGSGVNIANIPTSMQHFANDNWFMETMFQHQNLPGPSGVSDMGQPSEFATDTSGTKKNEDQDPDPNDPSQSWPKFFFP
ncbi:unnamed protein product [Ilex paraguariensis]|uniref:MADS-box domain-containing protein n=1 Tax=Ilex paraguariensis TaxID=185542 RepID=A0ABC8S9Z7_9AQUA